MAYPRQREAHIYKTKLLPPEARNQVLDLLKLKKESIRQDQEKSLVIDSMAIESGHDASKVNFNDTPLMIAPDQSHFGLLPHHREGKHAPPINDGDEHLGSVMNSVSTLEDGTNEQTNMLRESSTGYHNNVDMTFQRELERCLAFDQPY
eukprot:CAMPEP_0185567836 /NCGR_PEP_ID=MMETSP0434-20130131/966_1 /TAXON_ID=626734 ORGANISM="Favella taraikaensis, Strain Fe Narragansett Bay" /NCGR_SAMPLE_ID=MMETSP0434 /ASSEMBLY_ACC=CAM_ASM_000379 /LENGTH=148 /DNA_ID=CAMNT_0028182147 /DNA_START=1016 /DNA_END=1462 /DNA_ORIENTATION=-